MPTSKRYSDSKKKSLAKSAVGTASLASLFRRQSAGDSEESPVAGPSSAGDPEQLVAEGTDIGRQTESETAITVPTE